MLHFDLLTLHNGPGTDSNSVCKWVAWRLTSLLSVLGCWNVLTLTIARLYDILSVGLRWSHITGYA